MNRHKVYGFFITVLFYAETLAQDEKTILQIEKRAVSEEPEKADLELEALKTNILNLKKEVSKQESIPTWLVLFATIFPVFIITTYHYCVTRQSTQPPIVEREPSGKPHLNNEDKRKVSTSSKAIERVKDAIKSTSKTQVSGSKSTEAQYSQHKSEPKVKSDIQRRPSENQMRHPSPCWKVRQGKTQTPVKNSSQKPKAKKASEKNRRDSKEVNKVISKKSLTKAHQEQPKNVLSTKEEFDEWNFYKSNEVIHDEKPVQALTFRERNPLLDIIRDKVVPRSKSTQILPPLYREQIKSTVDISSK